VVAAATNDAARVSRSEADSVTEVSNNIIIARTGLQTPGRESRGEKLKY